MLIKGYTLIEMLFILFLISMMSVLLFSGNYDHLMLKMNMQQLQDFMIYKKNESILFKKENMIQIDRNIVKTTDETLSLHPSIYCESYVLRFNQRGNVDKGGHFICSYKKEEMMMVIQLGSGSIYAK